MSAKFLEAGAQGAVDQEFIGDGEVLVEREGYSRIRHRLTYNGKTIARLRWQGMRRAVYEAEGVRLEIKVAVLDKRISIVTAGGDESVLVERSRANPRKEELRVEMAEGDNFCLNRSWNSRLRAEASLSIHKEFYTSTLMVYRFQTRKRTQTTVRISIMPTMKREVRFVHRLLALVVCRIILERRRAGSVPQRAKEASVRFSTSARARERARLRS